MVDTKGNVLINDGTLQATGAAGLEIEDTTVDGSRGFVGDIIADAGSLVELNGATLLGGTLISHGDGVITVIDGISVFDGTSSGGLTNSAAVEVLDGEQLTMRGSITNTDSISLESTGDATKLMIDSEGVTLNGGGAINLSDNGNNIIIGATAGAVARQRRQHHLRFRPAGRRAAHGPQRRLRDHRCQRHQCAAGDRHPGQHFHQ